MTEYAKTNYFGTWDYVVCVSMIVVVFVIGLVTACCGRRRHVQRTPERFLLDNRQLSVVPVSMSMTLTFTAAINILGTPVDVYMYNTMFWWICIAYIIGGAVVCRMFVPLYFELQVVSAYEYLELRFNKTVRVFCSILFVVQMIIYLGVVLYAPSMVLKTVTGINMWASVGVIWTVAILYTTLGGMKAIVWSDVLQAVIILVSILVAIGMGCNRVGGLGEVLRIAREGERLKLGIVTLNPTVRHTVWSVVIGMTVIVVSTSGTNQTIVQRYLSLATPRRATIAIMMATVFKIIIVTLCVTLGLVVYAVYSLCDPISTGAVSHPDQLAPHFVMDLFASVPGLPGLFVSAILAASMSSLSSGLHSLSTATSEDIIKAFWPITSNKRYILVVRGLGLLYGFLILGFGFLAASLKQSILPLTVSIFGVVGGITLGVFTLGIFLHRSNSKGALIGAVISLLVVTVLQLTATAAPGSRFIDGSSLSMSGCLMQNATSTPDVGMRFSTTAAPARIFLAGLYRLSYQYYAPIGLILTVAIGMIASGITGFRDPDTVDPRLKLYVVDSLLCCLPVCLKDLVRRDGQHKEFTPKVDRKPKDNKDDLEVTDPMMAKQRESTDTPEEEYKVTTSF